MGRGPHPFAGQGPRRADSHEVVVAHLAEDVAQDDEEEGGGHPHGDGHVHGPAGGVEEQEGVEPHQVGHEGHADQPVGAGEAGVVGAARVHEGREEHKGVEGRRDGRQADGRAEAAGVAVPSPFTRAFCSSAMKCR